MTTLFLCPVHGVVLGAPEHSLVECRCGLDCAPPGDDPKAHRTWYFSINRQRRLDGRKRQMRSAKPLVRAS